MSELAPSQIESIVAACRTNAAEASAALGRAIDGEYSIEVGQAVPLESLTPGTSWAVSGLAVVLVVGNQAALFVIPGSSGIVPSWCASPDPTGTSKLTTLAQELGMLLLPEDLMPDDFKAAQIKNLWGGIQRGRPAEGAIAVPIALKGEGKSADCLLVWPLKASTQIVGANPAASETSEATAASPHSASPENAANAATTATTATAAPDRSASANPQGTHKAAVAAGTEAGRAETEARRAESSAAPRSIGGKPAQRRRPTRIEDLPAYTRSLLKIRVPVIVTLAEKRQPLKRIIELGPGAIIQFDKSCEETLDLQVGDHRIAVGEAVKVGDKFGLRITSMALPEERFEPLRPAQPGR